MGEVALRPGLTPGETEALLRWANAGGADFLRQFAGPGWRYPLTAAQVAAEGERVYAVLEDDAFAGIVEVMDRRDGVARVGRFLIDPDRAGRGIGTWALRLLCERLFKAGDVDAVALSVYRFNERALRCYRRCGFAAVRTADEGTPWPRVCMELRWPGPERRASCPQT
ncbi:MAG: GNAT family N-acetyltransferase [Clostridia bacterium]|nr:GNAT family N-acetyltransferase [Clostridia bacterium]